jgi:hypothetical protein
LKRRGIVSILGNAASKLFKSKKSTPAPPSSNPNRVDSVAPSIAVSIPGPLPTKEILAPSLGPDPDAAAIAHESGSEEDLPFAAGANPDPIPSGAKTNNKASKVLGL